MNTVSRSKQSFIGFLCTADPIPDDLMASHPSLANRINSLRSLT
jgi:hypothetical protein